MKSIHDLFSLSPSHFLKYYLMTRESNGFQPASSLFFFSHTQRNCFPSYAITWVIYGLTTAIIVAKQRPMRLQLSSQELDVSWTKLCCTFVFSACLLSPPAAASAARQPSIHRMNYNWYYRYSKYLFMQFNVLQAFKLNSMTECANWRTITEIVKGLNNVDCGVPLFIYLWRFCNFPEGRSEHLTFTVNGMPLTRTRFQQKWHKAARLNRT